MTPAASVSFFSFRPEFGDFLYAPVGVDRNEMTLSVLSALARLDIDPWKEAAELSKLGARIPLWNGNGFAAQEDPGRTVSESLQLFCEGLERSSKA